MIMRVARICVEVPIVAGREFIDDLFSKIADLAYDQQPEDRTWDLFTWAVGNVELDDE